MNNVCTPARGHLPLSDTKDNSNGTLTLGSCHGNTKCLRSRCRLIYKKHQLHCGTTNSVYRHIMCMMRHMCGTHSSVDIMCLSARLQWGRPCAHPVCMVMQYALMDGLTQALQSSLHPSNCLNHQQDWRQGQTIVWTCCCVLHRQHAFQDCSKAECTHKPSLPG